MQNASGQGGTPIIDPSIIRSFEDDAVSTLRRLGMHLSSLSPFWARWCGEVASWRRGTVSIHEVDPWLRFNPFIRRGFRKGHLRRREAIGSMVLYFHNESFNVLSHFMAAVLIVLLLLWPPLRVPLSSGGDRGPDGSMEAAGDGQGLYWLPSSAVLRRAGDSPRTSPLSGVSAHHRKSKETQIPVGLRGLHGLPNPFAPSPSASSLDPSLHPRDFVSDGAPTRYVPPGGAVSPRAVPSSTGTAVKGTPRRQSFLSMLFAPLFSVADEVDADTSIRPPVSVEDRLRLSLTPLLLGFLFTFAFSVLYHLFMPCCGSHCAYQQLLLCDVTGVVFSIGGSACAYFISGMPCASDAAHTAAATVMVGATLLCLNILVLNPMRGTLAGVCAHVFAVVQCVLATVLWAVLECSRERRPPIAGTAAPSRFTRHHGETRVGDQQPQRDGLEDTFGLVAWLQRHRRTATLALGSTAARLGRSEQEEKSSGSHTTGASLEVSSRAALHRAVVIGLYCLLHLGIYVLLVYPKSTPSRGGFTQGIYYHNLSYVWLFLGGVANATRFPEVLIFHWTRQAARHKSRVAAKEAAAWCAEELVGEASTATTAPGVAAAETEEECLLSSRPARVRNVRQADPPLPSSAKPSIPPSTAAGEVGWPEWWERASFAHFMVTYVVSASTLDYIGNSHNIWHVCTVLSALSCILATYYDSLEYDLVVCV